MRHFSTNKTRANWLSRYRNQKLLLSLQSITESGMVQDTKNKPLFVNREPVEMTTEHKIWLTELKQRYHKAQVRAVVKVNEEMLNFYW